MAELVKTGKAYWHTRQSGTGPATQVCQLRKVATGDRFAVFPEENQERVAVASVAIPEMTLDDVNLMLAEAADEEVA